MTWLRVNSDLEQFFYPDCGMDKPAEVTTNSKVQVPDDVAEQLLEHPSDDFEPIDEEEPDA